MAYNNYGKVYSIPTGNILERELCNTFGRYFEKKSGAIKTSEFRWSTKEEDTKQGTDAFIYGLPVDFTCNFKNKDSMHDLKVGIRIPGVCNIHFGVRTGNWRFNFETPVLVIGFDTGKRLKQREVKTIVGTISCWINDIIETGSSAYWQYCDQL